MRVGLFLCVAFFSACGDDNNESFDLGASLDLLGLRDHAMPPSGDLAGADLATETPPDLLCACTSPPAAACGTSSIISYASPGACVTDADAGLRCDYTPTTTPCTNGCYNATCSAALSFLGNGHAYDSASGAEILPLDGGSTGAGKSVSITVQTYPPGSASGVHLVYTTSTDPGFTMATDLLMTYDKLTMNNDQWYAVIPGQTSGTTIVWYIYADGYGGVTRLYFSNFSNNWRYTSN